MREDGLRGVTRGQRFQHTTEPDETAPCPLDLVNLYSIAERPNELWISDLTYGVT